LLETAVLRGQFIADNHVQAIRLNGRQVPVPEHGWDYSQLRRFSDEFLARKGFVEGVNTLEIDVHNGAISEEGNMWNRGKDGPMGLLLELNGSVMAGWRKEGAAMN